MQPILAGATRRNKKDEMRRIFFIVMCTLCTTCIDAQIEVTKFLGIPVDGSKQQMISQLKAKGYKYDPTLDYLTGEFNGRDVNIHIATNNNKVYRIVLEDALYSSETDIKIRFNTLCRQFKNNEKYLKPSLNEYEISETEDISFEMSCHNKRYEASYYQVTNQLDSVTMTNKLQEFLFSKYGKDLSNLTEEQKMDVLASSLLFYLNLYEDNSVWFMINRRYGKFGILMYYDNNHNRANGEDL